MQILIFTYDILLNHNKHATIARARKTALVNNEKR